MRDLEEKYVCFFRVAISVGSELIPLPSASASPVLTVPTFPFPQRLCICLFVCLQAKIHFAVRFPVSSVVLYFHPLKKKGYHTHQYHRLPYCLVTLQVHHHLAHPSWNFLGYTLQIRIHLYQYCVKKWNFLVYM